MNPSPSEFSEESTQPAPAGGYGRVVVRGMMWGSIGLVIAKASTFIAAIFLGRIFGSAEYSAAAAALSAAMVGDILTDGGLRRVLVTRGAEYARIARTAFYIALAFNLLGCVLMFVAAAGYRTDRPDAAGQLVVFGIALVLSTLSTIQRCKQTIDMQFGRAAFMGTLSSLIRNAFTVFFAWLLVRWLQMPEYSTLAFALPLIIVNLWEAIYLRLTIGRVPYTRFDPTLAKGLVGQGRWVIFAMLGSSLVARGDYLVATWLLHPRLDPAFGITFDQAGQYFWAFSITLALFSPLSVGMISLIQPVMARLSEDPIRQTAAFLRMVRTALFLSVPMSLGAILVVPAMVHLFWAGRPEWHASILAVQILAATECVRMLHSMSLATLEGRGLFKRSAVLVAIDGILVIIAAVIGCAVGTLLSLTIAIAIQRSLIAIAQALHTYHLLGGKRRTLLLQILPPLTIAVPLTILPIIAMRYADPAIGIWLLAATAPLAALLYLAISRWLTPLRFSEAVGLLHRRQD